MGCCETLIKKIAELTTQVNALGNVQIGYASDADGTDFSLTDNDGKCFVAFAVVANRPALVTDFAGKWTNICTSEVSDIVYDEISNTLVFTLENGSTFSVLMPTIAGETNLLTAENIGDRKAIAMLNGLAYNFDASNPVHYDLFIGFSKEAKPGGQVIKIQTHDTMLDGFAGLTPGRYFAGVAGAIATTPHVILDVPVGLAKNATTLLIQRHRTYLNI